MAMSMAADTDVESACRRRRRVPSADRSVPPRAAGALLPHARLAPRRGRRAAGHAAGRLARPRRVRGTRVASHVALPDRHQPVPQRAPLGEPATRQRVGRPRRGATRADSARRSGVARAISRRASPRRNRRIARPRRSLRAARIHLAGVRESPSGPAASPAGRPHPAGRARIPRERSGRHAGLDRGFGQQRSQTGAREPEAATFDTRRQRSAVRVRRPRMQSSRSSFAPTRPPISTRSWRCSRTTSSSRCRRCRSNTRAETSWPASAPAFSARAGDSISCRREPTVNPRSEPTCARRTESATGSV